MIDFDKTATGEEPTLLVEMNTTPLIDVLLVLLVMVIITIPLQWNSVNLELPLGLSPPDTPQPDVVQIDIDAANQVQWNGQPLLGRAALAARLRSASTSPVQPELHVQPAPSANYAVVAAVLAAAQEQGLRKIGIVSTTAPAAK